MTNRYYDSLINASGQQSAVAAMTVVDRLQNFQAGEQIIGAASTFLLLCERYGISAQDAFTAAKNCMNDSNKRFIPEFRAVRQYVENEL